MSAIKTHRQSGNILLMGGFAPVGTAYGSVYITDRWK